jgi:hypothetical protein
MPDNIKVKLNKLWLQRSSSGEYLEYPNISFYVSNNTSTDWNGVLVDYCLIGVSGKVISLQTSQLISEPIAAKSKRLIDLCVYESDISLDEISEVNRGEFFTLRVTGYKTETFNLGITSIAEMPDVPVVIQCVESASSFQMLSGTVTRGASNDGEVEVNANIAIQKTSDHAFARLELKGEILDKSGKVIDDNFGTMSGASVEIICQARGFAYIKDKKIKGASVNLTIEVDILEKEYVVERYPHIKILSFDDANSSDQSWSFPDID